MTSSPDQHLRTTRAAGAALVGVLTASLLALMSSTTSAQGMSAPARSDVDISPSRYPTIEQVARIFPGYRGGGRDLIGGRQLSVTTPDCMYFGVAATQPRAGKTASYHDREGESLFFRGGTSVVVSVYDFRRPKRAQAALDEQRDVIESCYGRHSEKDGYSSTYRPLTVPDFGQDAFGYRNVRGDAITGRDWFAEVDARQGRFLIRAWLQRDRNAPGAAPLLQLARASVKAAS